MENERYRSYLSLLDELSDLLETLIQLAQKKIEAAHSDDLISMDQILKQEQVLTLSVRGLEQKRIKQLEELGLSKTRLSELPKAYPKDLQYQAKQTAERLRAQYELYQQMSQKARNTLECNLHEIEKILSDMGKDPHSVPGYSPSNPEPPSRMKTDFRA